MAKAVKLFWGHYELRGTKVVRIKPGPGTFVGKVLKPYAGDFVRLYARGRTKQVSIRELRGA